MNLCNDGHDEVCYEGRNCPACVEIEERKDREKENEKLQAEIDELKETVETLNNS